MTSHQATAGLLLALAIIAAGIAWANRDDATTATMTTAPAPANIEQRGKDLKIEAPFTRIDKDSSGARIQAPGVDVQIPPRKAD